MKIFLNSFPGIFQFFLIMNFWFFIFLLQKIPKNYSEKKFKKSIFYIPWYFSEVLSELTVMLRDIVQDSVQCSSTCLIRDSQTNKINGVALACKTTIFDKQIDRLCAYQFSNQQLNDAVEFLKYVFNKLDVTYYLQEHKVYKPVSFNSF